MDDRQVTVTLAALAQEHRLRLVRILAGAGPEGLPAGSLAGRLGMSSSNLSFHLKELDHAGWVGSRREGRSIIYSLSYPRLSGLIEFLVRDCGQNRPEVREPAIAALTTPTS
jgi:ArsR family transcriptional regulator, arsenate/arsenite/antimonite-responsive transcriptional repressor